MPDLDFIASPAEFDPASIDFALVFRPPPGVLKSLPNLKAVLSLAAGLDHIAGDRGPRPDVPVEKLQDPALATMMAEYILAAVMRHHRDFPHFQASQADGKWAFRFPVPVAERRVGILGLGPMGIASAELLLRVGFAVAAWSRSEKHLTGIRTYSGVSSLKKIASVSDILVCLLPLNDQTRGIINDKLLQALPTGAAFVNVGRGGHVVAEDLLRALNTGKLSAATLDVLANEPPISDDRLWQHPKIFVTPHVAGFPHPRTAATIVFNQIQKYTDKINR